MDAIEQGMRAKGWCLKPEVLQQLSEVAGTSDVSKLHLEALNKDIRKQGYGILPDDISSKTQYKLQGKVIVQVGEVLDISRPSYAQPSSQDTILYCQCTDGRVQAHMVALKGCKGQLSVKTLPGSKLLLTEPHVEEGLIVLDGNVCQAMGGRVPILAEAWEAQQKYGGVSGRVTKKEIHNMGPAFSHFDPTRGRQKPKVAASDQTANKAKNQQTYEDSQSENTQPVQANESTAEPVRDSRLSQDRSSNAQPAAASAIGNASVVKQKLQSKLASEATDAGSERGRGRRGRGRGRGRRGRGAYEEEDSAGVMTLEEWEARKSGTSTSQTQMLSDEQLARQLQAQLLAADAAEEMQSMQRRNDIAQSLFFQKPAAESGRAGRRGRGRGRRGRQG